MNTLNKAFKILEPYERKRGLLILVPVIGMAVLEAIGVMSIMPFLAVVANPEILQTNNILSVIYGHVKKYGVIDKNDFLIALGFVVIALMFISAAYRTITIYVMNRFIEMRRHSISTRLLENYLQQPYSFFLNKHSGDMSKTILSEVDQFISYVIRPTFNMLANSLVVIAITTLLLAVNPWLALSAAGLLGGLYLLIFLGFKVKLSHLGLGLVVANKERFMAATEALGAIKDIKLLGCEKTYSTRFSEPSKQFAVVTAGHQTINQVPRYAIEAIAFSGLVTLITVLMITSGENGSRTLEYILPMAGLYAYSAYRLQPALQAIFSGFVGLRYSGDVVSNLYSELHPIKSINLLSQDTTQPLKASHGVELKNLTFTYPFSKKPALSNINLNIPTGSLIGIVGSSGAGKTTLVDVILGLLRPSEGSIVVDGKPVLDTQLRAWQKSLGYVPQEIFLTNGSIMENIALGVPIDQIDLAQVEKCARMAHIHNLVVGDLSAQYETSVGERGIRLSGGQRQRIGIARALYRNPEILVLDEATSALDIATEKLVMDAIDKISNNKTILIIAHRLSTVKNCDCIYLLDRGEIKFSGSYTELEEYTSYA
jgi:ABC-type bacteriocin/lantibiotic exporter with double-glycine peptidase domain